MRLSPHSKSAPLIPLRFILLAVLALGLAAPAASAQDDSAPDTAVPKGAELETFEQQRDFFMDQWPQLKARLEEGGPEAGIAWINNTFTNDLERRVLYAYARMGVVQQEWDGRNLDAYIPIAEAGIAECLRQAEAAEDEETKNRRNNTANVISYNLGADLAFCWDDEFEHTEAHFRRGLKAGEDCIRWRHELGNPPMTLSMAHWLRGIHRLALEDSAGALEDFSESLRYAESAVAADGGSTSIEGGNGSILLGHGWVSLTKLIMGDESARGEYDQVMDIFREQLEGDDEHAAEDARWYVMQLSKIENMKLGDG
ncbi:MAG TPA: hypothetical protein ENO21_01750 [Firmicutes bacterium]|nr:hypothetical protein [Bacillota bacterium]